MLVILSGVSGAGKDTVKQELLKRCNNFQSIPSYTTRAKRQSEVEGVTYKFIPKEEFEKMIKNNELYEYDMHHENYYGTSKKILDEKLASNVTVIKDIEVNGTKDLVDILKGKIKVVTIFLRVDKDELKARLKNRQDKLTKQELELRLSRFDYEQSKLNLYDYVIHNNNLEKTIKVIINIIENEKEFEEGNI